MKIFFLFFLLLFFSVNAFSETDTQRGNGMLFTPNKGQVADMNGNYRPELLYVGDGGGYKVFLEKNKIHYVLSKTIEGNNVETSEGIDSRDKLKIDQSKKMLVNIHRFDVEFLNSNPNAEVVEDNKVEGHKNYYYPHCSNGVTNVNSFNKLVYKNMYNNIDIFYYGGKEKGLKYDIIVNPNADYKQIKLGLSGIDGVQLRDNSLVIETSVGEFVEYMPRVYQQINGKVVDVKATYVLNDLNEIEFKIEKYNTSFPLVIDPVNYWITYLGGSEFDASNDITADANGNMIVTGYTGSVAFPVSVGSFQTALNGLYNVVVSKFSESGAMVWSTYYGGGLLELANGVTANAAGEIAVVGKTTSTDFPTSTSCFQSALNGRVDMFVVKLTSTGVRDWATLLGGSDPTNGFGTEEAHSVCFTTANELVVSGSTESPGFPVTDGGALRGNNDIGISKFSSTGSLLACKYIGGTSNEMSVPTWYPKGSDVVADHSNHIILVASSRSYNFPVTTGAFQSGVFIGTYISEDAVLLKLDNSLNAIWSTYFGGAGDESGLSVDVDANDNIFFAGGTNSINLPVHNAAQSNPGGNSGWGVQLTADIYVVSFTPGGAQRWATYNGGMDFEYHPSIAVDDKGDVYMFAGIEDGVTAIPIFACAFQKNFAGVEDQYFTKYDNNGSLVCNSWLGGTSEDDLDAGMGGITESKGFIYITSGAWGPGYPVTPASYQSNMAGGGSDITLVKICGKSCGDNSFATVNFSQTYEQVTICDSASVDFTINHTPCDPNDIKYEWTFPDGSVATSTMVHPTDIRFADGTHHVKLKVITLCGTDSVENVVITDVKKPLDYYLGDTTTCMMGQTQITIKNAQTAHWTPSDGLNDPNAISVIIAPINFISTYTITGISNIGCTYSLPMTITGGASSGTLFFPNTFTPNNDNLNDIFEAKGEDITKFDLKIYDRWGDLIFHSQNITQGWDGKIKGTVAQEDVYVWMVNFKTLCTGEENILKIGHVIVSR